jgi:hypothetical protein
MDNYSELPTYYHMRFYQIAKAAAESESQLELGLQSINQYQTFAEKDKVISSDWIHFRNAQLAYLIDKSEQNKKKLLDLGKQTNDQSLKNKIRGILEGV